MGDLGTAQEADRQRRHADSAIDIEKSRTELIEAGALPTAELQVPRDRMIATHCGHGQRAATALSVLEHRGYRNGALITEGVEEWRKAGGPVEQGAPKQRERSRA